MQALTLCPGDSGISPIVAEAKSPGATSASSTAADDTMNTRATAETRRRRTKRGDTPGTSVFSARAPRPVSGVRPRV